MYLFILESIGTSELILIGLVALIFFGPRKLPDLARTLGKVMNEFRRSTSEFKQTWEREVASEVKQMKEETSFASFTEDTRTNGAGANKEATALKNQIIAPEIKEVSQADFPKSLIEGNQPPVQKAAVEEDLTSKQNWL